jgi:hypothetical protein
VLRLCCAPSSDVRQNILSLPFQGGVKFRMKKIANVFNSEVYLISQAWWSTSIISALESLRKKASLGYITRPCLKKKSL